MLDIIRIGEDRLVQCQDNVIECAIRSWCWWLGFPVGKHYKVIMNAHCHKLVLDLDVARA